MNPSIVNAEFIKSSSSTDNALPQDQSEVVFIGRSNVGKSSLLNSLTKRKSLAKKSSTPGKTQLINFFGVKYKYNSDDYVLRFVDMPGFGYAKVSKSIKQDWHKNLTNFLESRSAIRIYIQLIDSRHFGLELDMSVNEYLNSLKQPDQKIIVVFTKTDKLNQSELGKLKHKIKQDESFIYDDSVFVSNLKNRGIEELTTKIFRTIFGDFHED